MHGPHIVILTPVISFIEQEVRNVNFDLETGGLLLGTKLPYGRLITHATPPGPNAIHRPGMFERDLEFSQAALNHFAKNSGVDYVGEWHKHPPRMTCPSDADKHGVIQTLRDPDYKTAGLMIFPILTREERIKSPGTTLHQVIINHCFEIEKESVNWFPYYMDSDFEFRPFEFQVAKCDLGTQDKVKVFYNEYLKNGKISTNPFRKGDEGQVIRSYEAGLCKSQIKENPTRVFVKTNGFPENQDEMQSSERIYCQNNWYDTEKGKNILAAERSLLSSTGSYIGARIYPNGRLVFRCVSPCYSEVYLDIKCKHNHPHSFPELFMVYRDKQVNLLDEQMFHDSDKLTFSPIKKLIDLRDGWHENGGPVIIGEIAKSLGFCRKRNGIKESFGN